MQVVLNHPLVNISYEIDESFSVPNDGLPVKYGSSTLKRHILKVQGEQKGLIAVTSNPGFCQTLTNDEFVAVVLVKGTISNLRKESEKVTQNGLSGILWKVSFDLNKRPYYALIPCLDGETDSNKKAPSARIVASFWGERDAALTIEGQIRRLVDSFEVNILKKDSVLWQKTFILAALGLNFLEAIIATGANVPVYAFRRSSGLTIPSIIVAVIILILLYGFSRGRSWAVYSVFMLLGFLAISGIVVFVVASTTAFYVPALREGGTLALLWLLSIPVNILAAVVAGVYNEILIEEDLF